MKNILFIIVLSIFSCQNSDFNNQKKLLAVDYRIFEGTIAWNLAKAVSDEDDSQIRDFVIKNKKLLSFVDPTYGQSLLALSVLTYKYISTRTLLELGANPNTFNGYNGRTPLMEAADIGYYNDDTDSRYLLLLLKFGANPNLEQKYVDYSGSHGQTALSIACAQGTLSYVKILVKAGASIEGKNGTEAISGAVLSENPELLMYLFNAGVDYKQPTTITDMHQRFYITDDLRNWCFDLGSDKYKKKMQIVDFLRVHGMDYRKTKIPEFYYNTHNKEYLEKY